MLIIIIVIIIILLTIFLIINSKNEYTFQEIPHFLTNEECDYLISYSKPLLTNSHVYDENDDLDKPVDRISKQCWLDNNIDIVKNISEKVSNITKTNIKHQELLQVVRYEEGGHFKEHYDACDGSPDYCKRMNSFIGPRYITVLIYLNDNYNGGETTFPIINKLIKPEKGKAVIFYNVYDDGTIIPESLHQGNKIKNGHKWIANKWIRLPS